MQRKIYKYIIHVRLLWIENCNMHLKYVIIILSSRND